MRAIDIMENCRERDKMIRELQESIWRMEKQITSCGGGSGEGGGRGTPGDRFAAYVARKDEMEQELKLLRRKHAAEQVSVILLTDRFPAARRDALRLYYARGRNADQIAMQINYSVRHVERMLQECREEMALAEGAAVLGTLPGWYIALAKKEGRL
jgi:hypothetical protein